MPRAPSPVSTEAHGPPLVLALGWRVRLSPASGSECVSQGREMRVTQKSALSKREDKNAVRFLFIF